MNVRRDKNEIKTIQARVMLILSMLATMFVGVSTLAAAELSIVGSADVVRNDDTFQKLATVQIDLPVLEGEGTRSDGKTKAHVVLVSLPDNFAIDFSDSGMLRDSKKNPRGLAQSCRQTLLRGAEWSHDRGRDHRSEEIGRAHV